METIDREELLNIVRNRLNDAEGELKNGMIPFNAQRFNMFELAYHHDDMDKAGLWGFKDIDGNIICEPKYLFMPMECGGKYIVCIGSGWENYEGLPKENGLWSKEMKWGLIDKDFNTLIPFEYDELESLDYEWCEDRNETEKFFICRKFTHKPNKFYMESEIRDVNNTLISDEYSDADYYIQEGQLVVYKDRERWLDPGETGAAGVYDFILKKEIISPIKDKDIEIIGYNLFSICDAKDDISNSTLMNEKQEFIGEDIKWDQVCTTFRNKDEFKYQGKTMEGKYYVFNILDGEIVDLTEISDEDFLKKY